MERNDIKAELPETGDPKPLEGGFSPDKRYGQYALFGVQPGDYDHEQISGAAVVTQLPFSERKPIVSLMREVMERVIPEEYRKFVKWIEKPNQRLASVGWKYNGNSR